MSVASWHTTVAIALGMNREELVDNLTQAGVGRIVGTGFGGSIKKTVDPVPPYGTGLFLLGDLTSCNARYLADCIFGVDNTIQGEVE